MSLILTRFQNIRAKANLDKWEQRPSRYGAFDLFARDTDHPFSIITPELKAKAFASIGNTLEVPVIDYDGSVTIGSTRSVTIADDENVSAMQSISFTTYSFGFTQTPGAFLNNEIGKERDWEAKFLKYLYKLATTLDTAAVTALTAAKTQVYANDLGFTPVSNVLTSSTANEQKILGALRPIFNANDYDGQQLNVVANAGLEFIHSQMEENAEYNAVNKTIQFRGKDMSYSNAIADAGADKATGFAVVPGTVGMLTRVDRETLMGTESLTGHKWQKETLPLLNIPVGVMTYDSVGDFNAIAGTGTADMTAAHKKHFGFSVDVAMVTPYTSAIGTNATPIVKLGITTA